MEMVDPVDDLKISCSVRGTQGPDFEVLDAKIASALNRIIHHTRFKKKVSLEEMKAQKRGSLSPRKTDRLLDLQVLLGLVPTILSRTMPTYFRLFFEMMIFRNSIRNGTKFFYQ